MVNPRYSNACRTHSSAFGARYRIDVFSVWDGAGDGAGDGVWDGVGFVPGFGAGEVLACTAYTFFLDFFPDPSVALAVMYTAPFLRAVSVPSDATDMTLELLLVHLIFWLEAL